MIKNINKFLIIFCLFFTNKVYALEEWTLEELKGDNVVTEYRYRFYEEVEEGEYLEKDNSNKYEFIDEERNIYGEYSAWQTFCRESYNIDIQKGLKYLYREIIPIQYVKIINNKHPELKINKIKIKNKDTLSSDLLYSCVNCNTDKNILYKDGYIVMQTSELIKVQDIVLNIDIQGQDLDYEIVLGKTPTLNKTEISATITGNSNNKNYKFDDNFKLSDNFTTDIIDYNIDWARYYRIIKVDNVCRYRSVKKYYYNILKIYFDDNYYKDISDLGIPEESYDMYKKDLNDYKIYYRYKTDEEIEKDNEEEIIIKPITNNDIPVKTGIFKEKDYKYLVIYVLSLILIALVIIKHMQNKSTKNNN